MHTPRQTALAMAAYREHRKSLPTSGDNYFKVPEAPSWRALSEQAKEYWYSISGAVADELTELFLKDITEERHKNR